MKVTGMVLILSLSNLAPLHSVVKPTTISSAATNSAQSSPQLDIVLAERNYITDQNTRIHTFVWLSEFFLS
jgi:hypothetical protein